MNSNVNNVNPCGCQPIVCPERVCVVHNNLKDEHLLKNDKNYLISWDKYLIDTPVLDLYRFFQNENRSI